MMSNQGQHPVSGTRGLFKGRSSKGLFVAIAFLCFLTFAQAASAGITTDCPIVAHRGFSYIAPENSLAAISEAIKVGAHGAEFDVYRCSTDEIVLMHDSTVNRTTDGSGTVTALPWSYLETLTIIDPPPAPPGYGIQRIPLMTDVLTLLKDSGTIPVCEIKQGGIAADVVALIEAADMVDQTAVISFNSGEVAAVEALNPDIVTGLLVSSISSGTPAQRADAVVAMLQACNADVIDANYGTLDQALVEELTARNIPVWAWTVDNQSKMEQLFDWGVASITTNRPDLGVPLTVPEPSLLVLLSGASILLLGLVRYRQP
ncbi:MAG: hypothetical protein JW818_21075 [Pirellulales bacterium]|nr:hypothetical protein [Pirellulales bacterium]